MGHMEIVLRGFQAESLEGLRGNIRAGVKNQVLSSPTGSGKTILGAYLLQEVRRKGKRALFVCDRNSLIDQTSAVLDRYNIPHGVIQAQHPRNRPWERIQVGSVHTLARRAWPLDLDLILIDECHTQYSSTCQRIGRRDTVTIGLTATAFSRGMGLHYDAVVSVTTTNWLVENGFLARLDTYAPSAPDMAGAKVNRYGEWDDDEAAQRSLPIVGDCVAEYVRRAFGQKFIAFGCNVSHCQELQRQFAAAGVQTGLYTYRNGDDERAAAVEEFRKPDSFIRGLISVSALAKGFDVPDVECIIVARPIRKSLTDHIQILGRGMRADPNNPAKVCTVLDHAGNTVRFWAETEEFFETGAVELDDGKKKQQPKKEAKERKPKTCPKCSHVHDPKPHCPACGHVYERRSEIAHVPGELSKVSETVSREQKQDFYSQLLHIAYSKGRSGGWVANTYRERFGVWPRNLRETPTLPTPETESWVRRRISAYFAKSSHGRAA